MKNEYGRLGKFKDYEFAFQTSWADDGEQASTSGHESREPRYIDGYETMKLNTPDKKVLRSSPILTQMIRKSVFIYLLSAVTVLAICFINPKKMVFRLRIGE